MGTRRMGRLLAAVVAAGALWSGAAVAGSEDGLVFRANGFYRGKADISKEGIKCEIPAVGSAIPDASFQMGLWNTWGVETMMYPDVNSPFGNPCGGWLQLQNNMTFQGINVTKVELKFRIAGAKRFRDSVPTRNGWPLACKSLRKFVVYTGTRLDPVGSTNQPSQSGQANVAFVQLLPILQTQLVYCLRGQYTSLPADQFSSFPVVVSARAYGVADNGDYFKTNTVPLTVTLRHTCGNGRMDDLEVCDGTSPVNTCLLGVCGENGFCSDSPVACSSNEDCVGTCVEQGSPAECTCQWPGAAN